jgi:hypothetical protein
MTSFTLTAPDGLVIEHVHPVEGWTGELVDGTTATWSDGSLASDSTATFGVTLRADVDPGVVTLQARQLYDSGAVVEWPVDVTVTPAEDSPSENLALAGLVGLLGVVVVVGIVLLALRRRPPSGAPPADA